MCYIGICICIRTSRKVWRVASAGDPGSQHETATFGLSQPVVLGTCVISGNIVYVQLYPSLLLTVFISFVMPVKTHLLCGRNPKYLMFSSLNRSNGRVFDPSSIFEVGRRRGRNSPHSTNNKNIKLYL